MVAEWVAKERATANKIHIFFLGLGILLLSIGISMLMTGNNDGGLYMFVIGVVTIIISSKNLYAWNRPRKTKKDEYYLSNVKLMKFIKPYHQITIETIAEHFSSSPG